MKFWKEHRELRMALMIATFIAGIALLVAGWRMTGQLKGLGIMLVGVALLLATLYFYNTRFADERGKKSR